MSNVDILSSNLAVLESQVFETVQFFFLTSTSAAWSYLQQNPAWALTFPWSKKSGKIFHNLLYNMEDLDSSVGIATRYGV